VEGRGPCIQNAVRPQTIKSIARNAPLAGEAKNQIERSIATAQVSFEEQARSDTEAQGETHWYANGQLFEKTKFGIGNFALMSFSTSVQTSSIEISNTSLMARNSASWSGVAAISTSFSC
jgi:hypothetical protein